MEYEIRPKRKFEFGIRELWSYKELFYFFTWRDIKVKYKQTFLGFFWAILQPFVTMVVFTIFFGRFMKSYPMNLPYEVFVISGLLLWNIFSSGVVNAGSSMVVNANIIRKIYFPRLIIPLSSVLVSLFRFSHDADYFLRRTDILYLFERPVDQLALYDPDSSGQRDHYVYFFIRPGNIPRRIEHKIPRLQVPYSIHDTDLVIRNSCNLSGQRCRIRYLAKHSCTESDVRSNRTVTRCDDFFFSRIQVYRLKPVFIVYIIVRRTLLLQENGILLRRPGIISISV
jgi:hypothetical protein